MARVKKTKIPLTLEEKLEPALVADWEQPYKVPGNWCWTTLQNIAQWGSGGTPSRRIPDYYIGNIPWIKTGELVDDYIYETEEHISEKAIENSSAKKFPINTVIIAMYGATIGKVGIMGIEATTNQACACGVCSSAIYHKYLFYYAISQKDEFIKKGKGGAQPNISQEVIKQHEIPIPPLAEQQRIVDRIERMFSKLDEVKENVQNVIDGFENRKSAILHKAFNGELTAKWREKNGRTIDEWNNECLKNLLYPMQTKKPTGEIFRYIDIDSIDNNCQKVREPKIIPVSEAPSRASRAIKKDSVLFSMVRPYLKNIAIISEELSDCIASTGFYVCDCKKEILPIFLYELLRSDYAINYLMQFMRGDNSPSIRKDDLLGMKILLPAIEEQAEIVCILDSLLTKEQQAKEKAEEVLERIELIKKSILARAFRGELGTNNPDEESSIELLKMVLSEDKNNTSSTKSKSKRVSIPAEIKAMLSNFLEKDILKLFYKEESDEVSIDDIMSINSNKFEVMDALKALEEKKLVSKKVNGIYKLAR